MPVAEPPDFAGSAFTCSCVGLIAVLCYDVLAGLYMALLTCGLALMATFLVSRALRTSIVRSLSNLTSLQTQSIQSKKY